MTKRYLNSFILTLSIYLIVIVSIFFSFDSIKTIKPKVDEKQISLNQVFLVNEEKKIENNKKLDEKKVVKKKKIEKLVKKEKKVIKKEKKRIEKIVKQKQVKKQEKPKEQKLTEKPEKIQEPKKSIKNIEKKVAKKTYEENFIEQHLIKIVKLIQQNIKYPRRAKALNIEGKVIVEFRLLKTGTVIDIVPLKGHKFLIKSSIKAIEKASKEFPKVTKDIKIKVPIFYKLV